MKAITRSLRDVAFRKSTAATPRVSELVRELLRAPIVEEPEPDFGPDVSYDDPDPPDCEACWGLRQMTMGRRRVCRDCAAKAAVA